MSQAGGSATINGILFQILGTLERESRIKLNAQMEDGDIRSATLVIEPTGGGGDVQILTPANRIIEQWKAKSGDGTWSLKAVIDDVFPDLYRAVDGAKLGENVEYWFVTEGRRGTWDLAQRFFESLAGQDIPRNPLAALDDTEVVQFSSRHSCTRRALFKTITDALREKEDIKKAESESETQRKLWHLLARFDMRQVKSEEVLAKLTRRIEQLVEHIEEAPAKRQQLCGLVMDLAAQGQVVVDAGRLLEMAGIRALSFAAWNLLRGKLSDRLNDRTRSIGYVPEHNVRASVPWPEDKQVLIIAGESGQGKTWQLAALACEAARGEAMATLVRATGDAGRDLQASADELWQHGLNHDGTLPFHRVAERRRMANPCAPTPWVTVCIDDVQTAAEAQGLIAGEWIAWQARLAMTAPEPIARAMQSQYPELVHVVSVRDFSMPELQDYLARRGQDWALMPADVRETLRRPLLATLYCGVASDPGWHPTSEYELYAACWARLTTAKQQADHPQDLVFFQRLVLTALDPQCPYPWGLGTVVEAGIDEKMQNRLESAGWLRRLDAQTVAVWHDRLLNWAVAEALVQERLAGNLAPQALADRVQYLSNWNDPGYNARLAYVPADVLWLATAAKRLVALGAELPGLVTAMEGGPSQGALAEPLYREVLPTLGGRVIAALVERARSSQQLEWNPYPRYVAIALAQIALGEREPVIVATRKMLRENSSPALQETAMRVLVTVPTGGLLDELWALHRQSHAALATTIDNQRFARYELTGAALRACAALEPDWLERKIAAVDPGREPVAELAYILAALAGHGGDVVWTRTKRALMTKVPHEKRRALALCIQRYRDSEEKSALISWIPDENDWLGPAALSALSAIDPDTALLHLRAAPVNLLSISRQWLTELLARRPEQTRSALRQWMASSPKQSMNIARCYSDLEDEMDAATIDMLLDALAGQVAQSSISVGLLQLLAKVSRFELLQQFAARAGSDLDANLAEMASGWVDDCNHPHELRYARKVLLKIGGDGITRLVNAWLRSRDPHTRITGEGLTLAEQVRQSREDFGETFKDFHTVKTLSASKGSTR